jgi:hypothetical protein
VVLPANGPFAAALGLRPGMLVLNQPMCQPGRGDLSFESLRRFPAQFRLQ